MSRKRKDAPVVLIAGDPVGSRSPDATTARPRPTADIWVQKNDAGVLVPIDVAQMTDAHLVRWLRYFRAKAKQELVEGGAKVALTLAVLDTFLKGRLVTAPRIYEHLHARGLLAQIDRPVVTIRIETNAVDVTAMGDTARQYVAGPRHYFANLECGHEASVPSSVAVGDMLQCEACLAAALGGFSTPALPKERPLFRHLKKAKAPPAAASPPPPRGARLITFEDDPDKEST